MVAFLNDDEKLLIRRAHDKSELAEKRYCVTATGFLNEHEQELLSAEFEHQTSPAAVFSGGYSGADKQMLAFVPEYTELDENEIMAVLKCSYYKDYELTHRDFLGALMGLGIERDTVGDILVDNNDHFAYIVVKKEMVPFLLEEFVSAGRARLSVTRAELSELEKIIPETQIITDTVASLRLDAVVASGFKLSRENANALIKSGNVYLDRRVCASPDKNVPDGALVNSKGYGKFKLHLSGNISKKGRYFIKIEKYI